MSEDAGSGDPGPASGPKDVLFVGNNTTEGGGAPVVRLRDGRIETGELREAREGQPIVGELVKLSKRSEHDRLFDVEVLATGPTAEPRGELPAAARKGPAKIATEAYRTGWDAIFGKERAAAKPN